MIHNFNSHRESAEPIVYQIRIMGQLDSHWRDWFGVQTVTPQDNGDTLLTGPMVDQAALFGLLKKVRDLGAPLVSVMRIQADPADASALKTGI